MEKERETLSLAEATTHLLEECRMVLPGVQALFGFQLIAVFNAGFSDKLSHAEQCVHLLALALVVVAGALIMSPARGLGFRRSRSDWPRFVLRCVLVRAAALGAEKSLHPIGPRGWSHDIRRSCGEKV